MRFNEFQEPIGQNQELNPRLWHQDQIRPEVKTALLKIAKKFEEFIDIPLKVRDIIVTGAQASLTYSPHSDLDLHLIVDYDSVDCDQEVGELLDTKRLLFKQQHRITIRDIPVEPGAEDSKNTLQGAAWSLIQNRWVRGQAPEETLNLDYDRGELSRLIDIWKNIIQKAQQSQDLQIMKQVLKLLKKYRKLALKTPSRELSLANLVYKSLRNDQTIQNLQQQIWDLEDQKLSLK
jgi:hypothetical protein